MELRLQPKPIVRIGPADKGIVSRRQWFVQKVPEEIREHPNSCLLLRHWRPKVRCLFPECESEAELRYSALLNRTLQNPFVEDDSEEVFLRKPPPCFVVMGKRGPKTVAVARDIAAEYNVVLIDTTTIVGEMVEAGGAVGKILTRLLRMGVALTLNFILTLASYKAHMARTRYRGYVIVGLPSLSLSPDTSVEEQVHYLFLWDLKPSVFVHVSYEDEDLVEIRRRARHVFAGSHVVYSREEIPTSAEEDESDLRPLGEPHREPEPDMNVAPSRPALLLPGNREENVWSELERYSAQVQHVVELFRTRIDPQCWVALDARVDNPMEMLKAQLGLLPIAPVPEATPFKSTAAEEPVEVDGEGAEGVDTRDEALLQVLELPPRQAFLQLLALKTLSRKFRWELSHYNFVCPVTLRRMEIVDGMSEFAVMYMRYIYFMASEEAMMQFLDNPRYYVLPIRPRPPSRFMVLGYPFSGRTSLVRELCQEYCVPLIDVDKVLLKDRKMKKQVYLNFCREKAEHREIIRLTALAWEKWREKEEERQAMIEDWVAYILCLLAQRIHSFYTPTVMSEHELLEVVGEGGMLELQGTALGDSYEASFTPSNGTSSVTEKIIKALKHEDYQFERESVEVNAESFLSSLWLARANDPSEVADAAKGLSSGIPSGAGTELVSSTSTDSGGPLWVHLLPPQSLSSFLIDQTNPFRRKRDNFELMRTQAIPTSFGPSPLQAEFFRWRLPCWLDIPLCERYIDFPLLLLHYLPECLMERPLVPDPIDPMHPSVLEAGKKARWRARPVVIHQTEEEVSGLINNAIEKAERDGMRCTGEVVTPGGWVLDNMVLDQYVWDRMHERNNLPNYIYMLQDADPLFRRILAHWYRSNVSPYVTPATESVDLGEALELGHEEVSEKTMDSFNAMENGSFLLSGSLVSENEVIQLLLDGVRSLMEGDAELDEVYVKVIQGLDDRYYTAVDSSLGVTLDYQEDYMSWASEATPGTRTPTALESSHVLVKMYNRLKMRDENPIGPQLQSYASAMQLLTPRMPETEEVPLKEDCDKLVAYFLSLLQTKSRYEDLTAWLTSLGRGHIIREIVTSDKKLPDIFKMVHTDLMSPFIKQPRNLLEFESEEVESEFIRDAKAMKAQGGEGEEEEEEGEEEGEGAVEVQDDVRVLGEAGPFCVTSLFKGILVRGKSDISSRYYGKLYFFSSVQAKEEFMNDPEKFAPYYSAIRCLPPLRVWVLGPMGSGKTTVARALADQCGLHSIHHLTFLNRRMLPDMVGCSKFTAIAKSTFLSDNHNDVAKALLVKFLTLPETVQEDWLENMPFSRGVDDEDEDREFDMLENPPVPSAMATLVYAPVQIGRENEYGAIEWTPLPPLDPVPQRPYFSFEMAEGAINNYVTAGAQLPPEVIDKTMRRLWTELPFTVNGFVMDEFPLRASDMAYSVDNTWLPDLIFNISLPAEIAAQRKMDEKLELWSTKLSEEQEKERQTEDLLAAIQSMYISRRRTALLLKMRTDLWLQLEAERPAPQETAPEDDLQTVKPQVKWSTDTLSLSSVDEERIANEVDQIIENEFKELTFDPVWETLESAKDRFTADIVANHNVDTGQIEQLESAFADLADVRVVPLNSEKSIERILTDVKIAVDPLHRRRMQRGEFAFTVDPDMAERLLQQGYYFLSKFGRWCPVQVYRMRNPINMYRPFSERGKITPVVYRNYVYFLSGERERQEFVKDPIKYTFNEPHHPIVPLRVAVIGPPKSGKTFLSERLAETFGLKVITMGGAIRFVLEEMAGSQLARDVDEYLRRGCFLPLRLKAQALVAAMNDPRCVTQGFVLDGVPCEAAMTRSLAEWGKLPFVILSLLGGSVFSRKNVGCVDVTQMRLPFKNETDMDQRHAEWGPPYSRFAEWISHSYNNLYETDAHANPAEIFYWAYDVIRRSFFAVLNYVEHCTTDRPILLQYLCVDMDEFQLRKSSLSDNCPVCWGSLGRLNAGGDLLDPSCVVQYRSHMYWVCPKHMEVFLAHPNRFFPPHAPPPPTVLPKRLSKELFMTAKEVLPVHGFGRCVVCRTDFPGVLDWEGSWSHAVEYDHKVYLLRDQEKMSRFMGQPWRYHQADTVFEHPPENKSSAVLDMIPPFWSSLPAVGYLEQSVAGLLQRCLQILGRVRPIHQHMSPRCAAAIFVALYLKVNDPRNKSPHVDKRHLDFILVHCRATRYVKREQTCDADESSDDESDEGLRMVSSVDLGSETPCGAEGTSKTLFQANLEESAEVRYWSAKFLDPKSTKMLITAKDELLEIPEIPLYKVLVKSQTYTLRPNPLPPVYPCNTYIYSPRGPIAVQDEFNYNTLYQPLPLFTSPFPPTIVFNPDKEFALKLYKEKAPADVSEFHMYEKSHDLTSLSTEDLTGDPLLTFMQERFIPRFDILDVVTPPEMLCPPVVVDEKYIIFNPQRDYTYLMLYTEFFALHHYLNMMEVNDLTVGREYLDIINRNLGLNRCRSEFMPVPRITPSMRERNTTTSYQDIFNEASSFYVDEMYKEPGLKSIMGDILADVMEIVFAQVGSPSGNYWAGEWTGESSFECWEEECREPCWGEDFGAEPPSVWIRAVLPTPPLRLNVVAHPYHSLQIISTMFSKVAVDSTAHERQFSVLDGIEVRDGSTKYFHVPTLGEVRTELAEAEQRARRTKPERADCRKAQIEAYFPVFDFFNIPWTSFLAYPFGWSYNLDLKDNFYQD